MKAQVSKVIAGGESIVVELGDGELTPGNLAQAFKVMDERLFQMNLRVLAVNEQYTKLVKRYPKAAMMVNDIILELTGQKVFDDKSVQEAVRLSSTLKNGEEEVSA